jgi:hypothetical protein
LVRQSVVNGVVRGVPIHCAISYTLMINRKSCDDIRLVNQMAYMMGVDIGTASTKAYLCVQGGRFFSSKQDKNEYDRERLASSIFVLYNGTMNNRHVEGRSKE